MCRQTRGASTARQGFALLAAGFLALFSLQAYGLEDPMQPPDFLEAPAAAPQTETKPDLNDIAKDWVLSYTLISPTQRIAILNGKTVRRGDRLADGVTIVAITPSAVQLKNAQGLFSVTMAAVSVKTPVKKAAYKQ